MDFPKRFSVYSLKKERKLEIYIHEMFMKLYLGILLSLSLSLSLYFSTIPIHSLKNCGKIEQNMLENSRAWLHIWQVYINFLFHLQ